MTKKERMYNIVNIAVVSVTILLYVYEYINVSEIFCGKNLVSLIALFVIVLLVHIIKAGRLYLALYGSNVDFVTYIKLYCKVTPTSVVIPLKLGDFFRMYCYGKFLNNVLKGVVVVLFDRFMDTIALATVIVLVWMSNGGDMAPFVYMLFGFLVFILFIYFVYPGMFEFWKKYLLRTKASEKTLAMLKMLETLNKIYLEIANVVRGRGIMLYFLSFIAWGVEIGSITLLNSFFGEEDVSQVISKYLTSAMIGNPSIELRQFIVASVALLVVLYLIIKLSGTIVERRVRG